MSMLHTLISEVAHLASAERAAVRAASGRDASSSPHAQDEAVATESAGAEDSAVADATDATESAMGWVFERAVRVPCAVSV